jgi:tRNA A37 threonylcarbamoyladenosine modification protein TsaB
MDSLALQAQAEKVTGLIDLVIDAQRGEFYLSRWEISRDLRREIDPLRIVSPAEFEARKGGAICAGPEMERKLFPSAAAVAQLAAGRMAFVSGEKLEPIYLRETSFVKASNGRAVS